MKFHVGVKQEIGKPLVKCVQFISWSLHKQLINQYLVWWLSVLQDHEGYFVSFAFEHKFPFPVLVCVKVLQQSRWKRGRIKITEEKSDKYLLVKSSSRAIQRTEIRCLLSRTYSVTESLLSLAYTGTTNMNARVTSQRNPDPLNI